MTAKELVAAVQLAANCLRDVMPALRVALMLVAVAVVVLTLRERISTLAAATQQGA